MNFSLFFLRLRTLYWLVKALIKRYHSSLFFGFSIGLLFFVTIIFAYPFLSSHFRESKTKKIGLVGNYTPINFPLKIQNLISFGLTSLTQSGEATSSAATSWEINDEGKIFTFHLNPDRVWQDGKPFTARDVNYNLKDAETSLIDNYTLQIKLKEPFSPLPILLSQPLFKEGLVGLGEYKVGLLNLRKDFLSSLTLVPFQNKEDLPLLIYRFYPSEEEAMMAYKLGEVDILENIADPLPFLNWPVKVESEISKNSYLGVFYNMEDKLLSVKANRQALTYALPNFLEEERPSSSLNPLSWAYNDKLKKYEFDLEFAKKILKSSEVSTQSGERKIVLSTVTSYHTIANQIAESWEKLGFETTVRVEPQLPKDFQALLAVQEISPDPDQYSLWHSTQDKTNITHYKNPRIDKLLEDGRTLIDREERRKKYFDFQKYLMDDIPAIFLYHPLSYTVTRP